MAARPLDQTAVPRPSARELAAGQKVKGPVRERHEADPWLIIATVALAAVGVLMIYSAGAASLSGTHVQHLKAIAPELIWGVLGIAAMLVLRRIDYRWLRLISVPFFLGAIVLLLVVLGPAIGPIFTQGGRRVRALAGHLGSKADPLISFHPAEIAKLALVIYLAHWLARRGTTVGSLVSGTLPFLCIAGLRHRARGASSQTWARRGSSRSRPSRCSSWRGPACGSFALLLPAGTAAVCGLHQQLPVPARPLEHVPRPVEADANTAYQTIQGLLALGLGGLFGQGLGHSRQPGGLPLPNAANDFVFAMVGQELGLVGAALVVGLFLFIAWRGIRVGLRAPDTFGGLLAIGITAWLTFQAFINIGVVVQLLPLTGITLPFVSAPATRRCW